MVVGTCEWTAPASVTEVRILAIGGGGGGGKSTNVGGSGGGGAGAMVLHPNFSVSGTISVVVGVGAAARATYDRGADGAASSFGALTAVGGGGGGLWCHNRPACQSSLASRPQIPGAPGGSGGGSGAGLSNSSGGVVATQSIPAGATSYGNRGGNAVNGSGFHGAGGGGAGAAGADRTNASNPPTAGGIGLQSDITGVSTYYAAGGGGSGGATTVFAIGGVGGGGSGGGYQGSPKATGGTANTGSGGGGAQSGSNTAHDNGGAGGSGIVIIRYATVPVNSVLPAISGDFKSGETLSVTSGTWAGSPTSYSYQWKSAATSGGSYSNVGSTSSTYELTDDDIGRYFKVEVNATNINGAASQSSGLITVTGLSSGASSTLTVRASRAGYRNASATTTSSAIATTTTTTDAPVVEIVVSAPVTTVAVGQGSIATIAPSEVTIPAVSVTTPIVSLKPSTSTTVAPRIAVTTTTVPVAATPPGPVAPPAPKIDAVAAGEVGVKVGDKTEKANVARVNNQYVVSVGALKATIAVVNSDGESGPLDDEGTVRMNTGDKVKITMNGFQPGSTIEAWLFSTPTMLGTAKVGADGSVTGVFTIPANADDGAHRIALVAKANNGKPTIFTVGVMLGEWDGGPNVAVWLIALPIVLAVAGALVIPATRRRRRSML